MPARLGAFLGLGNGGPKRFPHLLRHQTSQALFLAIEEIRRAAKHGGPLGERRAPPSRERTRRELKLLIDGGVIERRVRLPRFAGARVHALDGHQRRAPLRWGLVRRSPEPRGPGGAGLASSLDASR